MPITPLATYGSESMNYGRKTDLDILRRSWGTLRIGGVVNLYHLCSQYHRAHRIGMVTLLGVSTERADLQFPNLPNRPMSLRIRYTHSFEYLSGLTKSFSDLAHSITVKEEVR